MPLSNEAIDAIASAIFERPGVQVVQFYSDFDREPLVFADEAQLAGFIRASLASASDLAYLLVVYPDMGGRAVRRTVRLDPSKVPGHTLRYTWDGWGLISVQLTNRAGRSVIGANSEKRALAWAPTYPEWDPPSTWNWKAVASHVRRLKRVLARSGS